MTQEEFLERALLLKKENPELEIRFCVNSEEVLEYGWTAHKISNVEICPWWFDGGERIYTDEDEIRDEMADLLCAEKSDSDIIEAVDKMYSEQVKQGICVFTYAG